VYLTYSDTEMLLHLFFEIVQFLRFLPFNVSMYRLIFRSVEQQYANSKMEFYRIVVASETFHFELGKHDKKEQRLRDAVYRFL